MIKKLILISTVLITFNAYSEPSDFVRNELINKPVTYMTIGIDVCNNEFAKERAIADVTCYYEWDDNRLLFSDIKTIEDFNADSYEAVREICKNSLHPVLNSWFLFDQDFLVTLKHLSGFNPRGYIYKDSGREEEFTKFIARSVARITIWTNRFSDLNRWECEWEVGDKEPSLKWIPES